MSSVVSSVKQMFFSDRTDTLLQWQEKSFLIVFLSISLAALPALINSISHAIKDELWINLVAYICAYLICLIITFVKVIPFKVRAWTGVLIFFGLGSLSIFSTGPVGSGRIWLFTTSIFAVLTLGIYPGLLTLTVQLGVLFLFGHLLDIDLARWTTQLSYSLNMWVTTSITFSFLSIVSIVAMGSLIRGLSLTLDQSRKTSEQLLETTKLLNQRIKAHRQSIESLKESEERWHFALEGAGDGVWDWDLTEDQIYFSPRWKKMLGYNDEELGTTVHEWFNRIHPEERTKVVNELQQNIKDQSTFFQNRYRIRCKDESYKWVLDRGKVMTRDNEGTPLRIIGTHADITLIKNMEDQQAAYEARLHQAHKMEAIGTLAGGIAHDFNNILSPIMGYTELAMQDLPEDSPVQAQLKEIYSASTRAKDLVQQILAFSRQDISEVKPVNIGLIVQEALKLIRASIPATIQINQKINEHSCIVNADPTKIHQIIMNLATNAYHAMEETGGEMTVGLQEIEIQYPPTTSSDIPPGKYGLLNITDTGSGISDDIKAKIFDPFFTTKTQGKGTGMGLSVVHGIIEGIGGTIQVESSPGEGTEFKIYLPITGPHTQDRHSLL